MAIVADGRYWKINGVKKLLVGGTWGGEPHLYEQQYSGNGITISDATDFLGSELSKIAAAGGNYFRCTLVNFASPYVTGGKVYDSVFPFAGTPGNFQLDSISTDWVNRVDALLYRAEALGIIVQLEMYDTWWCINNGWKDNSLMWWHPENVVSPADYTLANTGLPDTNPGGTDPNELFTAPAIAAANTNPLLIAQKLFVTAVCNIAKRHGNAFIQIQNESIEPKEWEDYWGNFINAQGVSAPITSMMDDYELTSTGDANNSMLSSIYNFGDSSQQWWEAGLGGSSLDEEWTILRRFQGYGAKPVNTVKIYSRWNGSTGGEGHNKAVDFMFLSVMAGNAACAFHPGDGDANASLGTSPQALDAMRAGRWLDDNCDITVMGAVALGNDKWGGKPSQAAWACHGTHAIAIYVTGATAFTFDTTGIGDIVFKTWYRIDSGATHSEASEVSSTTISIDNPFNDNRALVIISGDGGVGSGETEPPPENIPWIPPIKPIPKPWPFIPERLHTEIMEWKTDVIRTKAVEERIALRSAPRYFYDYSYIMDERQFSRAKLICQDGEDVYLPIWSELTKAEFVASGVESLLFDTAYAHYIEGGQAIIWSADDEFEVVTIDTVTPTGITWTGALVSSYSLAFVMPVKTCKFTSALKTRRYAKTYSKTAIGFVTTETEDLGEGDGISSPAGESIPITNHNAETGDLTGWTIVSGDWLAHNAWGASPSGGYYFIPSISTSADGVLRQSVSLVVGGLTALIIDEGKSSVIVTWEQDLGAPVSDDIGNIKLTFLDGTSGVISSASSPSQKGSLNGWETLTFETQVPIDSRTMQIDIEAQFGGDGLYNDSKWDNIRASVSQNVTIPEAETTILLDCNVLQSGTIDESYLEEMDILDYNTGDIWSDEAFHYPMRHSIFSWHNSNREQEWDVRQWLHNRRGKWGLFWLPSWNNDFEVTENILATDNFLVVKDVGYADHVDIIRYGMITTNGGARYFFRILSADNTITDGFETLALGDAFGITLTIAEIAQASLLTLMRLSADRVEIRHDNARKSFISIPLMDPVFNGGVMSSIAGVLPAMTGAAQGWISLHATIAGVLPAMTGAANATVRQYIGNVAGTLPAMTGAASGWISLHADAAGTLPAVTGTASATYTDP